MSETDLPDLDREWKPFIDGEFVDADSSDELTVRNPATGDAIASVQAGGEDDVAAAIEAADEAYKDWRWLDDSERSGMLFEISRVYEEYADELAVLETLENGKPVNQSANDVTNAISRFRFFAGGIDKFYSEVVRHDRSALRLKTREPYGVAGLIIPWNWPPMHFGDFVAPALAAGNTVVLKPSPYTPLSELRMVELVADILPPGVLNVVPGGIEAGVTLTSHEGVDKVAFTGSAANGEKVLEQSAANITSTMLELGGKNPAIVFQDADLEEALSTLTVNVFYNCGQACSCPERVLVSEDIYDEFVAGFARRVEHLTVGDGMDGDTDVGPLANANQVEKVHDFTEVAETEGADILAQADTPTDAEYADGFWAPPTVFTNVDPQMRIAQEEVFGPVTAIIPFSDEAEAIAIANDVQYGLTSAIWTENLSRGHRVASQIEAGVIGINHPSLTWEGLPFGGYKRSGMGRKNDFNETMREFTQVKSIEANLGENQLSL